MISFTINVKNEISSYDSEKNENMAMLSAIIRNSGKLENGEITEDDILEEDMDALIALYQEETKRIEEDTLVRKNRIRKMLTELKTA